MRLITLIAVQLASLCVAVTAQQNCTIPTGDQFARTKYGPAISAHARQFPASAIDGNGYFRAGAQVPNNFRIRLNCLRDQYGDAIHKVYASACRAGEWTPALPSCLDHAECGSPFPYVRGGIPSERRSADGVYPHGHVITFKCFGNRRLMGKNKIHCDDGKWTQPRFRCVGQTAPKTCGLPPSIEGATVAGEGLDQNRRYPSGATVRYQCLPGRQLTGDTSAVVCSNGRWSEAKFMCETAKPAEIGCKPLRLSGTVPVWDRRYRGLVSSGTSVTFQCLPGRVLTGSSTVVCYDGKWNFNFTCDPKITNPPAGCTPIEIDGTIPMESDSQNGGLIASGTSVAMKCMPELELTGNSNVVCNDGKWSDVNFTCATKTIDLPVEAGCAPPVIDGTIPVESDPQNDGLIVDSGSQNGGLIASGTSVTMKCMPGLELTGNSTVDCYDGKWSDVNFTCDPNISTHPAEAGCKAHELDKTKGVDGPAQNGGLFPSGSSVDLKCMSGMKGTGNRTVVCRDGNWSTTKFRCVRILKPQHRSRMCRRIGVIGAIADKKNRKFPNGSVVTFTCRPGLQLLGNATMNCINGFWSKVNFMCLREQQVNELCKAQSQLI